MTREGAIVIRSKTLLPTKDFKEWAKRIREVNPNAVVIPCDAEVVSADAVPQLRQTDTLIIADALRYLAEDTERHELDRARAEKLREQILQYGASMCHSADASQNLAKPNKALKGSDLISRQDIEWTEMLVADGDGQYHSEDIAYRSQIDSLPSADTDFSDYCDRLWEIAHERGRKEGELVMKADAVNCLKSFYKDMGVDMTGIWNKQLVEIIKDENTNADDVRLALKHLWDSIGSL